MHRLLVLLIVLAALAIAAQASGQTLPFVDDFDDGDFDGWSAIQGTWAVEGGELSGQSSAFADDARIVAGDPSWSDYVFTAEMTAFAWDAPSLLFRVAAIGSGLDNGTYYQVEFHDGLNISLGLIKDCAGFAGCTTLAQCQYGMNLGQTYTVEVSVEGSTFELSIDGNPVLSYANLTEIPAGRIGFKVIHAETHAHFDNVSVQAVAPPDPGPDVDVELEPESMAVRLDEDSALGKFNVVAFNYSRLSGSEVPERGVMKYWYQYSMDGTPYPSPQPFKLEAEEAKEQHELLELRDSPLDNDASVFMTGVWKSESNVRPLLDETAEFEIRLDDGVGKFSSFYVLVAYTDGVSVGVPLLNGGDLPLLEAREISLGERLNAFIGSAAVAVIGVIPAGSGLGLLIDGAQFEDCLEDDPETDPRSLRFAYTARNLVNRSAWFWNPGGVGFSELTFTVRVTFSSVDFEPPVFYLAAQTSPTRPMTSDRKTSVAVVESDEFGNFEQAKIVAGQALPRLFRLCPRRPW